MVELADAHAMALERSCAVTAVALSEQRREGVRLVTGERRSFGLNGALTFVHVPYPAPYPTTHGWTRRTLTCGVALQCSPSKERVTEYRLNELSARELRALTLVEAGVALGWIAWRWPGLLSELRRVLPELRTHAADMDAPEMLNRAVALAASGAGAGGASAAGQPAAGLHDAAGIDRQVAAQPWQDALDDNAKAPAAAVLGSRRR